MVEIVEDKFEFAVYPILRRKDRWYHTTAPATKKNDRFRTQAIDDYLQKSHYYGRVIVFPEVEKYLEDPKFNSTPYPPLVDVYTTEYFDKIRAIKRHYTSTTEFDLANEPKMSSLMLRLMETNLESYWDERFLFRFYALNSFLGQTKDKTFGEHLKNNIKSIYKKFRKFDEVFNTHTNRLFEAYSRGSCLLRFTDVALQKNAELIYSLTKEEVLSLLPSSINTTPTNSRNYSRLFSETVAILRSDVPIVKYNYKPLAESISGKIRAGMDSKGFSDSTEIKTRRKNTIKTKVKDVCMEAFLEFDTVNQIHLKEIHSMLIKHMEVEGEIDPDLLLSFMIVLACPRFFFNRAGKLATRIISECLKKFGVKDFLVFVEDVFLYQNEELPTFSDWQKFMKEDVDINELPPTLMLATMLDADRNQVRGVSEIERYRKIVQDLKLGCE